MLLLSQFFFPNHCIKAVSKFLIRSWYLELEDYQGGFPNSIHSTMKILTYPTNWLGLRSERVRDARGHKRGGRVGCGARASAAATCAYAHNTTTAATSRHIVILEPSPCTNTKLQF